MPIVHFNEHTFAAMLNQTTHRSVGCFYAQTMHQAHSVKCANRLVYCLTFFALCVSDFVSNMAYVPKNFRRKFYDRLDKVLIHSMIFFKQYLLNIEQDFQVSLQITRVSRQDAHHRKYVILHIYIVIGSRGEWVSGGWILPSMDTRG